MAVERQRRLGAWLDEVRQDLHFAVRQLGRHRGFAAAAALTLTLAVGVASASYAVVHRYLVRPLPYPDADRLYVVIGAPTRQPVPDAPSLRDVDWTPLQQVFAEVVAWDLDGFTLAGDAPVAADGAWVSRGYFRALGLVPALGRGFRDEEYSAGAAPAALISHQLWRERYGGDAGVIGQVTRMYSTDRPDESELVTIVGVLPDDAWHMTPFTDVLRPLTTARQPSLLAAPAGVGRVGAEERLNRVVLSQLGERAGTWHMSLASVQDEYTYRVRPVLVTLLGAALLLLCIAGASVSGALVARAVAREGEFLMRVALGASSGRLLRQMVTESCALAVIAVTGGTAVSFALLGVVSGEAGAWLGVRVPAADGTLSPGMLVLLLAAASAALVCLAFGVVPALLLARRGIATGLRRHERGVGAIAPVLRRALIGGQLALTMVLLVGAATLVRASHHLATAPLGFEPEGVVKSELLLPRGAYPDSAARTAVVERMLASLAADPRVTSAAVSSALPFSRRGVPTPLRREGDMAEVRADVAVVTPGFFATTGIGLLAGRVLSSADVAGQPVVAVVSSALARLLWSDENAIGRRLRVGAVAGHGAEAWATVVGVVGDTRRRVSDEVLPDVYLPFAQRPQSYVTLAVRTSGGVGVLPEVMRARVAAVDDALALSQVEPLAWVVARDHVRHRVLAVLLSGFGAMALGLAMLALYSSLVYLVSQRERELAVRSVLGATDAALRRLVVREEVRACAVGVAAGGVASYWLTRWLTSQVQGTIGVGILSVAAVVGALTMAVLAAVIVPARRAARTDPAMVLRAE